MKYVQVSAVLVRPDDGRVYLELANGDLFEINPVTEAYSAGMRVPANQRGTTIGYHILPAWDIAHLGAQKNIAF